MALNNTILFSAAYAGFVSGAEQVQFKSVTAADYATLLAQALAFATAVDTAIPADGAISAAGAQIAAAYTVGGASCKVGILTALCAAAFAGRNPIGLPPANYTGTAAAIAVAYAAMVAVQTVP